MIISFSVTNFRSFRERQTLNLHVEQGDELVQNIAYSDKEGKFRYCEQLLFMGQMPVATTLELKGIRGKVWTTKKGVKHNGQIVNNQMIYRMLKNPLYIGRVPHKETSYPGEHQAIIEQ